MPYNQIHIRKMTKSDSAETREWLRREEKDTGHSFYINRHMIESACADGQVFVARLGSFPVGLLVDCGRGPEIIATHPLCRRRGIARKLINYSATCARRRGKKEIRAHCVTREGLALCRAMGFRPKKDRRDDGRTILFLSTDHTACAVDQFARELERDWLDLHKDSPQ